MSGSQGGQVAGGSISPSSLNQIRDFVAAHTNTTDPVTPPPQPLSYQRPGTSGPPAIPLVQSPDPAVGINDPTPTWRPDDQGGPKTPPAMANSAGGGALTAGLGAGDAAAAGASDGSPSGRAVAQMMKGIGDADRASIQQKIDMLKMIAGG